MKTKITLQSVRIHREYLFDYGVIPVVLGAIIYILLELLI